MVRPRQISDQEILETARDCFVAHGPGVSIRTIAKKLGVSQPALFKRFGSKMELMIEALKPEIRPLWIRHLEAGPDERELAEQFREFLTLGHLFFEEHAPRLVVLKMSRFPMKELLRRFPVPPPVAQQKALAAWLSRCCDKGLIRQANFDAVALAIMGALHGHALLRHMLGIELVAGSRDAFVDELTRFFCQGLEVRHQQVRDLQGRGEGV